LIAREWYLFFLGLFRSAEQSEQTADVGPVSDAASVGALAGLEQQLSSLPHPALGTMAELQQAHVPWMTFTQAPDVRAAEVGTLAWDGGTTLGVQMTPNVVGRVNESTYYYVKASSAITKGQLVMFTGAVGASGVPTAAPATGVTDGSLIMGFAAESMALNAFGLVQFNGSLRGVNTSAFVDGDVLWYNPAVTGGVTKIKPAAPNIRVQVAAVTSASNNGTVLIRVSPGSVLGGTDSNVQFGTLANNDIIQYDSALQYWKNVPASSIIPSGATTLPSAITVGASPYTYQNTATYPVDIIVNGGGVTALDFSRDNTTFYSTGSFYGMFALSPNDRLRVTYTTAPAMTLIPR
jgi:hypothetical protein